jgi:hypothetical protein
MLTLLRIGPAASSAKAKAVLALVRRRLRQLLAFIALGGFPPNCRLIPLAVMLVAKSTSKMLVATSLADSRRAMDQAVFLLPAAQLKIGNSIVVSNLILVVNLFIGIEKPSKVLLHHQSVLQNVATAIAVWMVRLKNFDVAVGVFVSISGFKVWSAGHVLSM